MNSNANENTNGITVKQVKPEQWSRGKVPSKAKTYLKKHLEGDDNWIASIIAREGVTLASIDKIHDSHSLFRPYEKKNFRTNFRNLKASIDKRKAGVAFDQEAFEKESQKYKNNAMLEKGYPRWNHPENNAKRLLEEDIKDASNSMKSPGDLRESRPEYEAYPKDVFRNQYYREKRKVKETSFWQHRRNKQMRKKKVEEDVQALIDEENVPLEQRAPFEGLLVSSSPRSPSDIANL
eukprot:CAMPEP_0116139894 /NCGR_PEP_ID=MMETSP0329-20121206/13551_1 /TAXON_ID=697910 /ORGANISM="Pseudo-nitzschia arenysensis, Strain B593" /LENGTH=235 /DNA_ID=CAMNT_0003634959 /DNA_START=251 /DNA_END=961 /DNA_ORIENTATION=+